MNCLEEEEGFSKHWKWKMKKPGGGGWCDDDDGDDGHEGWVWFGLVWLLLLEGLTFHRFLGAHQPNRHTCPCCRSHVISQSSHVTSSIPRLASRLVCWWFFTPPLTEYYIIVSRRWTLQNMQICMDASKPKTLWVSRLLEFFFFFFFLPCQCWSIMHTHTLMLQSLVFNYELQVFFSTSQHVYHLLCFVCKF